ncbi:Chanoclavine-I aldehyde reductase [Diaporthe eres]|nr:Chanoclavine-I aldehyde reductase [Diaporthe eres]
MSQSKLFTPVHVGRMELKHRIAMAPLTRLRADDNHVQLPIAQEYYAQRASVPGTLLITESTLISQAHGGVPQAPAIWNNEQIQGWKKITREVHSRGSSIKLVSSSAVPMPGDGYMSRNRPNPTAHEMDEQEIWACIADFAQAAKNAIAAGFDGVEIHGANGYLVDQFLQDRCNKRADAWGGMVEARSRFATEVAKAVSAAIGPERVGLRISPWSSFEGMRMHDPVPTFCHLTTQLKSLRLGYLHVIESRVNNNVDCEPSGDIGFILDIWGSDVPVLLAGGNTADNVFEFADKKHADRDVIFVFGRYFISNPDLPCRLKNHIRLADYDRETFYKPESSEGHIDYPFSKGFEPRNSL